DVWQAQLVAAWQKADAAVKGDARAAKFYDLIVRWNGRADADSTGAVAYHFWKKELGRDVEQIDRAGRTPPQVPAEQLLKALAAGAAELHKRWGRLEVQYGEIYRVGRRGTGRTWPVGGGSVRGMATPRAIGFPDEPTENRFVGQGGQTSTQIVQL